MKKVKMLVYINIVLLAVCFIGSVYGFITIQNAGYRTSVAMEIVVLLSSIMYLVHGYKKDAAKFYRQFMILSAFAVLAEYIPSAISFITKAENDSNGLVIIESLIVYGNYMLLGMAKDLGKKVSYILCGINSFFYAIILVVGCVNLGKYSQTATLPLIALYTTWFVTSGIAGVMTVAKYTDKQSRNTK